MGRERVARAERCARKVFEFALPAFEPLFGRVLLPGEVGRLLKEIWSGVLSIPGGSESCSEIFWQSVGPGGSLKASLVQKAECSAPLGRTGDLHSVLHDIRDDWARKTRRVGGGSVGFGERCMRDDAGEDFMDASIRLPDCNSRKGIVSWNDDRVGEVVSMRDFSAARPATHQRTVGPAFGDTSVLTEVAERHAVIQPAIDTEQGSARGAHQHFVDGHVHRTSVRYTVKEQGERGENHKREISVNESTLHVCVSRDAR